MSIMSIQPEHWPSPKGYSNAVVGSGKMLFLAGQIAWDKHQVIIGDDMVSQVRQVLLNIREILDAGGATPENLVRLTWYVTDKREYLSKQKEIGAVYREVVGRHYPAMTAVEVSALMEPKALVEIEATAIIP